MRSPAERCVGQRLGVGWISLSPLHRHGLPSPIRGAASALGLLIWMYSARSSAETFGGGFAPEHPRFSRQLNAGRLVSSAAAASAERFTSASAVC